MPLPSTTMSPREDDATLRSAELVADADGLGVSLAAEDPPLPEPLVEVALGPAQPARTMLTAASATARRDVFLFIRGAPFPPRTRGRRIHEAQAPEVHRRVQEPARSPRSSTSPVRVDRTSTDAMSATARSTVPVVCTVSPGPAFQLETTVCFPSVAVTVSWYCHGGGLLYGPSPRYVHVMSTRVPQSWATRFTSADSGTESEAC